MKFKNEVVVGIVVLAAIAVLIVGAFWLSGKPWGAEQRELAAVFQQVGLLRPGNPVVFRGVNVGRVTDVELAAQGRGVLVVMEIRPGVQFGADAAVVLAPQSFFGDWQAEITTRAAFPALEFTTTSAPNVLPGATLPDITQLTAVAARIATDIETLSERVELAFTEETALDIRATVENVQEISEQLSGFVTKQTQTLDAIAQNALVSSNNIQQATAAVERVANGVEGDVESILTNARLASENLQDLSLALQNATEGLPAFVAQADTTLERLDEVAQNVNTVLAEVGPELGPTLVEARQALATLERVGTELEQGQGSLGRMLEDPALYEELQRSIALLNRLMADLQDNPTRYLRGLVNFF